MKYKLVKLSKYSGSGASVYSIYLYDDQKTLFDIFILENKNLYLSEIEDLNQRLITIGTKTGAREHFFKLKEGNLGDGVCALYDKPKSNLRLYLIRYGSSLIIIGGGGPKPKNIKAFQDNDKLTKENYLLRKISEDIRKRTDEGEIMFSEDGTELIGNLDFNNEENE